MSGEEKSGSRQPIDGSVEGGDETDEINSVEERKGFAISVAKTWIERYCPNITRKLSRARCICTKVRVAKDLYQVSYIFPKGLKLSTFRCLVNVSNGTVIEPLGGQQEL